jgi:Tfp pilus assembly protein PilF
MKNQDIMLAALLAAVTSVGFAQQLPPGTHSVDDHTKQSAASDAVREAESSLEKQDFKTAEVKLKVLAAADPKDGRVQYDLGFAEERNGEEADAAKAYAAWESRGCAPGTAGCGEDHDGFAGTAGASIARAGASG